MLQEWHVIFGFVLLGIAYAPVNAQANTSLRFEQRLKQLKTRHALVLAAWALVNLTSWGIVLYTTADEQLYYFFAMNGSWGLVNLAVAWFIYSHHNEVFNQPLTLLQQMDYQRHVEKAILFNIGIDMAFAAFGLALEQHGHFPALSSSQLWKGFGASIILQGSFLLVQDVIFYRLHLRNRKKVYTLWQKKTEGK